jgi:hypothetical protein
VSVSTAVLAAVLTAILGAVVGRISVNRPKRGSISLSAALPRRTPVEIDGKAVTPPIDGSPIPIDPGPHTLTIPVRGERREYTFNVGPGEHLVFVQLTPKGGAKVEDKDP